MSIFVQKLLPGNIGKLYGQTFIPYMWLFLIGAVLCEAFDYIVDFLKRYWFVFLGLMCVTRWLNIDFGYSYGIIKSLLLGLAIIGFAYQFPKLNIRHDVSYGIYIYHMIVINAMIELGYVKNAGYVIIALALSVAMAILSYVTIGKLSKIKKQ